MRLQTEMFGASLENLSSSYCTCQCGSREGEADEAGLRERIHPHVRRSDEVRNRHMRHMWTNRGSRAGGSWTRRLAGPVLVGWRIRDWFRLVLREVRST